MAQQKPITLKEYFVRDAVPTQIQFEDLIDSFLPKTPDETNSSAQIDTVIKISRETLCFINTAEDQEPDFSDSSSLDFIIEYFQNLLTEEVDSQVQTIADGLSAKAILTFSSTSNSQYIGRIWTATCVPDNRFAICLTGWAGTIIYDLDSDSTTIIT